MPPSKQPPTKRLPRLNPPNTLDEVVENFDRIVKWAIDAPSRIGYFATIYKRSTIAIHKAIDDREFEHTEVMTEFTKTFSKRFFDALNAHFQPRSYEDRPTLGWQVSFAGAKYGEPIIFQHMLSAVNAHVNLDLGVTAAQVGRGAMADLHSDFNMVNAILASQVQGVLDALAEISPRTKEIRDLMPGDEAEEINKLLMVFRDVAWHYANVLAEAPQERVRELIDTRDAEICTLGACYLYPPGKFRSLVNLIAEEENRDVSLNVRTLDVSHATLNRAFLTPPVSDHRHPSWCHLW
jgi:uncharacterized protein DUF5995